MVAALTVDGKVPGEYLVKCGQRCYDNSRRQRHHENLLGKRLRTQARASEHPRLVPETLASPPQPATRGPCSCWSRQGEAA